YGEWPSPIGVDDVAADSRGPSWPCAVGPETWWCQSDPETGTVRLLRSAGGAPEDILDKAWSVRNRVLGYGGRPYLVIRSQTGASWWVIFTLNEDQRLYRVEVAAAHAGVALAQPPLALTPADQPGADTCYAEPILAPDGAEVWCIREITRAGVTRHDDPAPRTKRDIVAVPLDGRAAHDPDGIRIVAAGSHHFLNGIRVSPGGRRLCWLGWDHPRMPWDSTELMVADLAPGQDGKLSAAAPRRALGGDEVSVPQAEWADDDALYAMADPDGWWNLHRIDLVTADVRCVLPMAQECADAIWLVGTTWFGVTDRGVVLRHGVGDQRLSLWDPATTALRELAPGWTQFNSDVWAAGDTAVAVAAAPDDLHTVLRVDLSEATVTRLPSRRVACAPALDGYRSRPSRGIAHAPDGHEVHYVYYPPTSPACQAPAGALPPLLVQAHGGPTDYKPAIRNTEFDFFCSRGFAVVSVDYGGSTGYGREYRNRLRGNWGTIDVTDSIAAAQALIDDGLADASKVAVRGSSAGGWTTLACLAFSDFFCAGAVYYPISDPLHWSGGHTHDFESRYVESLIGPSEDKAKYAAVSPVANAGRISSPFVILQGAEDPVCPPEQAERIIEAVAARALWHRYVVFAGEGHGFRKRSSVCDSLRAEAELYRHAMGISIDPERHLL
ncbi:MAG: prolyl oligopeptidase family serine peptidase, partial [Actinomycetia bacterium]|nr:prolyl oligopeptidase family serine peptidase [Actinomycetes bacterium]